MTERVEKNVAGWVEKILQGDPQAVSRAITSVENRDEGARELLRRLFPHTGRATIIGVTGAAGTGKSTLVDVLTAVLRKRGKTVGVLAVDPTSPFTGGAILGDRIRMQGHWNDPGAYIRSMATRGSLGGLARATLDAALVLDAAGKEYILVETVGVGQDEVEVAKLADVTLLLLVPGMGDDVQAFKAGIMEIADIFVINKSDRPGAERVEMEIQALLNLAPTRPDTHHRGLKEVEQKAQALSNPAPSSQEWRPPIVRTIATRQQGVEELLEAISAYLEFSERAGARNERQMEHWRQRLLELLRERLLQQVMQEFLGNGALNQYAASVASRAEDPYTVVDRILEQAGKQQADKHGTKN